MTDADGGEDPDVVLDGADGRDEADEFCCDEVEDVDTLEATDDIVSDDFDSADDGVEAGGVCGNGIIEGTESCDGDLPRPCTTSCDTVGERPCVDCAWAPACVPPAETCATATDDDCDSQANERNAVGCRDFFVDEDGDTYGTSTVECWCEPAGFARADEPGDCNDLRNDINPGAVEACDSVDGDCDGAIDEPSVAGALVQVTDNPSSSTNPSLAWSGVQYGIVWADNRDPISTFLNTEIYFGRLDSLGVKIGTDVRVTNADRESDWPSLAWAGDRYAVVWMDTRDGGTGPQEIYATLLNADGTRFLPTDVRITNATGLSSLPRLVWTGADYGLIWMDGRDGNSEMYFTRLSTSVANIGPNARVTSTVGPSQPRALLWTGSDFAAVWTDSDLAGTTTGESRFARIGTSGVVVGAVSHLGGSRCTGLAWTGSSFAVSCEDVFLLLNPDGSESAAIAAALPVQSAALAWNGERFGLVWPDYRDGNYEIYFLTRSVSGAAQGRDFRVTETVGGSSSPSAVALPDGFAAAWGETMASGPEIFFARFGCP